jgi:hypothetical protein
MDHFAGLNVSSTRESALWIAWASGALRLQASPMRSCEQRQGNGDYRIYLSVTMDIHGCRATIQ